MSDIAVEGDRLAKIRLLLLDVDGVLTDGRTYLDAEGGETWPSAFRMASD